ncbi:MAG TPA: efflux RND transporter periplasmic adaptor subunit [Thermoanaerobaculia bacterium]|nr:efflux RND transporter periplasmic adaptor subunit [Thermoanaerobaculia bacterium]
MILTISALAFCKGAGNKNEQYRTEKVDRGNITMTVTATGTLSAVTTVQVGSQVSGVIARLYADFNSRVTKGQLLAELDPTPFQQQVEQRQADVTKSKVEAANTRINYDRQLRLVKAGLSPQSDLDSARAAYEGANAQVQQSTAALNSSLTNLKYTKIVSPIDGIVVDRQYDVGQTVAASFSAPTLFSIAQDMTKMQVQADVDQSDIGRIAVGQPARFSVDSYPDQEFRGRISQIRLNATVSQNVVSYPVIIEVPNPEEKLRPKMTANVTIDVAMVPDVLRIPNSALRFKPETATGGTAATTSGGGTAGATATTETTSTQTATTSTDRAARWRNRQNGQTSTSTAGGMSPEERAARFGNRTPGVAGAAGGLGAPPVARKRPQTVYVLTADNKLTAVEIRTGITDGHYTQVVSGDLKPGDNVVIGLATTKVDTNGPPGSSNPVGGRPGGGGGGRGGR